MTQNQQSPSKAHGGARKGAGRKKGSGIYGEATQVIRVPISKITTLKNWLAQANANIEEIEFNPPSQTPDRPLPTRYDPPNCPSPNSTLWPQSGRRFSQSGG